MFVLIAAAAAALAATDAPATPAAKPTVHTAAAKTDPQPKSGQVVHPEKMTGNGVKPAPYPARAKIEIGNPPATVKDRTGREVQNGLRAEDYAYTLGEGVKTKEVAFWSEGVACYGKIFYPKGFDPKSPTGVPAVVLGQGYAGNHMSIEKYANRMAEKGLVAMVIDYRGWGFSDGIPSAVTPQIGGGPERDNTRFTVKTATMRFKRTQIDPPGQQKDYRNAISYIQGEPGVDYQRIGVWGSSLAGGNAAAVAGQDARVKAVSVQVPAIVGGQTIPGRQRMTPEQRADAIQRARTGQGHEYVTGFSRYFAVDQYVQDQSNADNWIGYWISKVNVPFQAVAAENDQLIPTLAVKPVMDRMTNVHNLIIVPGVSHFEMYSHEPFEISSNAAADWFVKYLNAPEAADPPEAARPAAAPAARGPGPAPAAPGKGRRNGTAPGAVGN